MKTKTTENQWSVKNKSVRRTHLIASYQHDEDTTRTRTYLHQCQPRAHKSMREDSRHRQSPRGHALCHSSNLQTEAGVSMLHGHQEMTHQLRYLPGIHVRWLEKRRRTWSGGRWMDDGAGRGAEGRRTEERARHDASALMSWHRAPVLTAAPVPSACMLRHTTEYLLHAKYAIQHLKKSVEI